MLAGVSIMNLQERSGAVFRYDLTFLCKWAFNMPLIFLISHASLHLLSWTTQPYHIHRRDREGNTEGATGVIWPAIAVAVDPLPPSSTW